jgi:hypothetical protein
MRNFGFILLALIFLGSCGTTGHVQFYNFSVSKYEVDKELRYIITKDSAHLVPPKWIDIYKTHREIEVIYVYFSKSPEEMYRVGFTGDDSEWKNSSNCKLSLDGLFNGDHWEYRRELSYSEMKRIRGRFEKEILSRIKYNYYKTN